ncbi:hypothetical protein LTR84_008768 [Exophiala bonariae]|uniref:Spindle pole body component n=1 Tax=Exophiala bonariae TaxID=1690606 RepID=A0AAV9MZK4_9EURO|nr:hypothetical protein LTR84_008768 [Exophiala bonariae]
MSRQNFHSPFSETLTEIPSLLIDSTGIWNGFIFDNSLESGFLRLKEPQVKDLPELRSNVLSLDFNNVPLPDLSIPPSSPSRSSQNEFFEVQEELGETDDEEITDIWALPEVFKKVRRNRLIFWDNFLDEKLDEPQSGYLSEVSPRVFTLIANRPATNSLKIVKDDVLLNAAFELVLGRSSGLFRWIAEENSFHTCWENIIAIGYSGTLLRNTIALFSIVGGDTRILVESFRDLDAKSHRVLPSRIALLSAARSALFAIHKHLEDLRTDVSSLLQVNRIVSRVKPLIQILTSCCTATKPWKSDHEVILSLTKETSAASMAHSGLTQILQEIFTQAATPALENLCCTIGLSSPLRNGHTLDWTDEEDQSWRRLLSHESSLLVSQTQRSLQLLGQCSTQASVIRDRMNKAASTVTLRPIYAYTDVREQEKLVLEYENTMRPTILASTTNTPMTGSKLTGMGYSLESEDMPATHPQDPFHLDMDLFNSPARDEARRQKSHLEQHVISYLTKLGNEGSEPLQLPFDQALASSVAPMIAAQHRLLSYAVLQMLFDKHNLIAHIKIQRDFHLLGHPTFSQRLTTALFDPNQRSGEHNRSSGGSTGLRLQSRDAWPPAGSELRLVLMGILSDSLTSSKEGSLESTISFAIRDMPSDDLEKCRDVDSIHALNFLRLQYKAPNQILENVLSTSVLDKYDRIFQHLLLILRLHNVTEGLLRDNCKTKWASRKELTHQKLILEMHHFVMALADYCQNTAMTLCWQPFDVLLKNVKAYIDAKDYVRTLNAVRSQDYLNTLHEQTLDDTLRAMLLRNKQTKGLRLLHDLFGLILQVAAYRRTQTEASRTRRNDDDITMKRYEHDFRRNMAELIDFLRSETQSPAQQTGTKVEFGIGSGAGVEENPIEHLLLRLDIFGYWSLKRNTRSSSIVVSGH